MPISIQTNVNALTAQNNLRLTSDFQSKTIQRLTSGYRINSSGDDAAGLAVANKFRSDTAELTQGVRNANDGISQLQITDGGANNISKILDRMKTLATQAASSTFTGDRATLDTEFQALKTEIDRQAANVGLSSGGSNNVQMNVYIGGGGTSQANASVTVDLSGLGNTIDSAGLGVSAASLQAGGVALGTYDLRNKTNVLDNTANDGQQVFTFNLAGGSSVAATVTAATGGITGDNAVAQLNSKLNSSGISAFINSSTGILTFSSTHAFSLTGVAGTGTGRTAANDVASVANIDNTGLYESAAADANASFTALTAAQVETLTFTKGGVSSVVQLQGSGGDSSGVTKTAAINKLAAGLAGLGINVLVDKTGNNITFESSGAFTISKAGTAATGIFAATGAQTAPSTPTAGSSATANALTAITALGSAVAALGSVQGKIGAGENKLQYAINLAQSQISGFSAAESQIRDADVAMEAANLTKAQVLVQASMAAMAQANSAPQAVLALLR